MTERRQAYDQPRLKLPSGADLLAWPCELAAKALPFQPTQDSEY